MIQKNTDPAATAALGPLGNAKVLKALFSDDAIKNKRNIEAVEVAPNTLLSARILEHVEAEAASFEKVKADIEQLVREESARLAKESGEATLAELKKSGDDKELNWSPAKTLSRLQGQQVPPDAVKAIFRADTEKLPAYEGAAVGDGYTLYRIERGSSRWRRSMPRSAQESAKRIRQPCCPRRPLGLSGQPARPLQDRHQQGQAGSEG